MFNTMSKRAFNFCVEEVYISMAKVDPVENFDGKQQNMEPAKLLTCLFLNLNQVTPFSQFCQMTVTGRCQHCFRF